MSDDVKKMIVFEYWAGVVIRPNMPSLRTNICSVTPVHHRTLVETCSKHSSAPFNWSSRVLRLAVHCTKFLAEMVFVGKCDTLSIF